MTAEHKPPSSNGSGYVVLRRDHPNRRLKGGSTPYEHPTHEAAEAEAARLASEHNACFEVFTRTAIIHPPSTPLDTPAPAEKPAQRRTIGVAVKPKGVPHARP